MSSFQMTTVASNQADETLWSLLSLSVGNPTKEKMQAIRLQYADESKRGIVAIRDADEYVGCLGYEFTDCLVEIMNIAVLPSHERNGIGRQLVEAMATLFPGRPIEAETDGEAVGFYKATGFSVTPCDRRPQYPNRWTCRRVA